MLTKVNKYFSILLLTLTIALMLSLVIKGKGGNPIYYQYPESRDKQVGGPFESTGTTSRYVLVEAIVENNSFLFTEEQARFTAPDFVQYNDKFFSIFTPGVSFLAVPFYITGNLLGLPQIGVFSLSLIVSLINVVLVAKIVNKLGASLVSGLLVGVIFLFATNALSYSLTLTQHPLSTMVILLSALNIFGQRTLLKNLWLGILVGIGLLIDLPNLLVLTPVVVYTLVKHWRVEAKEKSSYKINLKLGFVGLALGIIPFLALYGWYNYRTTGSYTLIGQSLGRSEYFQPEEYKERLRLERESRGPYDKSSPLNTRDQAYNLYILLVSNERGWFMYSPIVFTGVLGIFLLFRQKNYKNYASVYTAVILVNIVVYSLFGAHGGWAFGPRYLIPGSAIMMIGAGVALDNYKKKIWFIPVFLLLTTYSIGVNVLGAMTTTQVPPKVEAVNLSNPIPYTYEYNWQLMTGKNLNSSLFYNVYANRYLTSLQYAGLYTATILILVGTLYLASLFENGRVKV